MSNVVTFSVYKLMLSETKSLFNRLNQWWQSGKSFFGMSLKRELHYGATARCFLSDMVFLRYRYFLLSLHIKSVNSFIVVYINSGFFWLVGRIILLEACRSRGQGSSTKGTA